MPEISLNPKLAHFFEFLGRSVWLPRGMAVMPFGFPASPGIFLGGMFRNWPNFDFTVFSEGAKIPEMSLKSQFGLL